MRKALAVLTLALVIVPASAFAHNGKEHKILGTVVSMDATHMDVRNTKGTRVSVPLTRKTMFMRGNAMAKASDVTTGTRVVIEMSEDGNAEHVRMPAAKKK